MYRQQIVAEYPVETNLLEFCARIASASVLNVIETEFDTPTRLWMDSGNAKVVRRIKKSKAACIDNFKASGDDTQAIWISSPELHHPKKITAAQLYQEDHHNELIFRQKEAEFVVFLDTSLGMSSGKSAAQVAHAVCAYHHFRMATSLIPFDVVSVDTQTLHALADQGHAIRDHGITEVEPGTMTVVAVGKSNLDAVDRLIDKERI